MRKIILPAILALGALGALPTTFMAPAMAQEGNLAERRAISGYQQTLFPVQVKSIQAAAGFEVPVEPKWETLTLAGQTESIKESWYLTDVYVTPLVVALTKVASDDMGKSALKAKLKKIVFAYNEATAPASAFEKGLSFEDGVLTLNFKPGVNADQIEARAKAIQEFLEGKL